jgi:hypothetical protein
VGRGGDLFQREEFSMTAWRQLDLLKDPRRQRGTRPPPAPERQLHIAVADVIRWSKAPGWIVFHPANGELRTEETGALLKRMLVLPGVSDFILLGPGPAVCALELKRRPNKPTEAQTAFLEAVRAIGGHAEWTDSYDRAIEILKGWGAVRVTVAA